MIIALVSACMLFLIPLLVGWNASGKPNPRQTLLLAGAALVSFMLWKQHSPYPMPLNWDIWEHQTIINAILNGQHALFPSQLSDTFGFTGYTTLFHYLLALPQYIFHPDVLGFWWAAELYMVVLTSFAAYGLTEAITKNKTTALIAGILSSCFFESSIVFTPYFLLPQTVAAILWVYGLIMIIRSNGKPKTVPLVILIGTMCSMHFVIGGAGVLIYGLYVLMERASTRRTHQFMSAITILLPVAVYGILFGVTSRIPQGTLNFGEATHYIQTVGQTLASMQSWYGFLPILFIPFGLLFIAKTVTRPKVTTLLTIMLTIAAVVFAPIAYSMKFYVLFRYCMVFVIACGIQGFLNHLKTTVGKTIVIAIVCVTQFFILAMNIAAWQTPLFVNGTASHVSTEEQEAIAFVNAAYKNNHVVLVSDPATSYIVEALSGINSFGGAYMKPANRKIIASLPDATSQQELAAQVSQLTDTKTPTTNATYLFIVSARYLAWTATTEDQRQAFYFNIWKPRIFTLENRIEVQKLTAILGVQPVFQNNAVVIFSLPTERL